MDPFEEHITSVYDFIEALKRRNQQVREYSLPCDIDSLNRFLQISYDHVSASNIVLKSETFLELGNPSMGSCAMTLYTNNTEMVRDGEIILIGPDVGEVKSYGLPFGQVILVAGKELDDFDYHALCRHLTVPGLMKGYMVKSTLENIWSRISNNAAKSGFNFQLLGAAIMRRIKLEFPKVSSLRILFVTSGKEDILALKGIRAHVRDISQKIKVHVWEERGVNLLECNRYGHCGLCEDRDACGTIAQLAKKYRNSKLRRK